MSDDTDIANVPNRPRLQFSLLALLIFATLICLALGYVFRPRYCTATALFLVRSQPPSLLGNENPRFDAREFEIVQKSQVAMVKSYFVLQAAVREPGIASLPILAGKDDPVEWISEHIDARFPGESEILEIRLRGKKGDADQLRQIVDAVVKAYEKEVIYAEQQRRLATRDNLARQVDKLNQELTRNMEDLESIKAEAGSDSVDVVIRQRDVDTLSELSREFTRRLEIEEINATAPEGTERIKQLQPAIITYE